MRDLNQVRDKLKVVLLPLGNDSQDSILQKLRDCTSTSHYSLDTNCLLLIIIWYFNNRHHQYYLCWYNYFLYTGDLWGPLLVCLLLSTILSITAPGDSGSLVFAAVFVIVWCGAVRKCGGVYVSVRAFEFPADFFSSLFAFSDALLVKLIIFVCMVV